LYIGLVYCYTKREI